MKVIFLNIEGVLNCDQTYVDRSIRMKNENKKFILDIDEEKVQLLGDVCEKTEAKVVLTSAGRFDWENGRDSLVMLSSLLLQRLFDQYKIEIVGITPVVSDDNSLYCSWKENEIKAYLKDHPEVDSFCIIDIADYDLSSLKEYLIMTTFCKTSEHLGGFLKEHAEMAIKLLSKKRNIGG